MVIYNYLLVREGVVTMNIFLSRLSPNTTLSELEKTAHSLLSKKIHIPFTEPATLRNCKIMKIKDAHGGVEFHGLLNIKPASAGKWFIKSCRSKKIHNKPLLPHQYITRNSAWQPNYHSEADHRRPSLTIRYITKNSPPLITEGLDSFRREY